jgi:predicted outer membrane protein
MNRRNMILALSAASIPLLQISSARAQTVGAGPPMSIYQYTQATLLAGSMSKQMSDLALQRATNARVKEFAGFESAEQTTMAQVLTNDPAPPPIPLDVPLAGALRNLASMSGMEFDQAYVRAQLMGHAQLMQIQQAFLQSQGNMSTDAAHIAMLARTTIEMHLTMLQDVQNALQS